MHLPWLIISVWSRITKVTMEIMTAKVDQEQDEGSKMVHDPHVMAFFGAAAFCAMAGF